MRPKTPVSLRLCAAAAALLVLPFAAAPASGQALDPSRWMAELHTEANGGPSPLDQTLAEFIFPGTHVSGSYGIPDFDYFDPFDAPPLACPACILPGNDTILTTPGLDVFVGYLLVPFAKTQKRTIGQQLSDGARAFDLRFFRATAADQSQSPELTAGQFYIHRTFAGASSTDVFTDLATFLNASGHDREIILLNFSLMYEGSGEMGTAALEAFFQQLFATVGMNRFAPKSLGDGATLTQLAAAGTQVVVSYDGTTPLTDPAISRLVWPAIATRYFGSPTVNVGGNNTYPKADTWKTERELFNWMKKLGNERTNNTARYQMFLNMGVDGGTDFPDMLSRSLLCNIVPIFNDLQSIYDAATLIQKVFTWIDGLSEPPPKPGSSPGWWDTFKDAAKQAIQNALLQAVAEATLEAVMDAAGVCPAINDDWDRFTSLEEVAAFTNPKLLPSIVGLPRGQVNIVLADYYPTALTAEAKRMNAGAARLTVTIQNVHERECHDCFPPNGPGDPDYYPELVFKPNGWNQAPANWSDWPLYDLSKTIAGIDLNPGHYSHWGGPWLEMTGDNINPNWLAMRSVARTTSQVRVEVRIWDQDNNLCPSPLWCGQDDDSKIAGSSTVVAFDQDIWDAGTGMALPANRTARSGGETGLFVFDSSQIQYIVDVCQWSAVPGQPVAGKLCGLAGFLGNTAPVAFVWPPATPVVEEGSLMIVRGDAAEGDPPTNADGDPNGKLASWEWDCAYTGVPADFTPNRGCRHAEILQENITPMPTGGDQLTHTFQFYVTDGPANRLLAFRATDAGGLSAIDTEPYTVTNFTPVTQFVSVVKGNFVSTGQSLTSRITFRDRGVDDHPYTCEWWDGPVGTGTLLPAQVEVMERGIAYDPVSPGGYMFAEYECSAAFDLTWGPHVINVRVLDKDGAAGPSVTQAIDITTGVSLADALGSPVLSNIHSPIDLVNVSAWNAVVVDPGTPAQENAAQSGPVGELQSSWLQATISGPGKLTFWWRIVGDQYDELQFSLDNNAGDARRFRQLFTSTVGWQQETVDILAGQHTLDWVFRDGYQGAGGGKGWVRDVVFTPVTVTVSAPVVPGVAGTPYPSTQFSQSGGTDPTTWALTAGALPAGMTLSPAGVLSGTPSETGNFPITVTGTDALGFFGSGDFVLSIAVPTIVLGPTALPGGTTGTPYAVAVTQFGGGGPVTFAVTSGQLPFGLGFLSNGTVSGTPTWAGTFTFTVTATDVNGFTGSRQYTVTIVPGPGPVVTNVLSSGPGSLRDALASAPSGTVITFDPALSGQTIVTGGSEYFLLGKNTVIDASALPQGVTISAGNSGRVFRLVGRQTLLKGLTVTGGSLGCIGGFGPLWLVEVTVTGCSAGGSGGGISLGVSPLSLTNTTVSGNHAPNGGGIFAGGPVVLVHSTVSGNSAGQDGGGILLADAVNAYLSIENSIVAGNVAGASGADIADVGAGVVTASGANLIGNNDTVDTVFPAGPLVGTPAAPLDPLLAALSGHGGPTPTMPPLPGSPALDAAVPTASSPATDQRGVPRPGGGLDDLGAVEGTAVAPLTELTQNGDFSGGVAHWNVYATNGTGPDPSYIQWTTSGGVFQFYRVAPPPGTANQAVVFQGTGQPIVAGGPVEATFELGNSTTARKRISVLMHDGDFSDLSVCTFYLTPGSALATYRMRTHTTEAWTNATVSFYAASAGNEGGGYYLLDNVSVQFTPQTGSSTRTECVDAAAPATGGATGSPLLTNGDFGTGLAPWVTYGQIASQLTGGVFEFFKLAGAPSGVVLQATGAPVAAGQGLLTNLQLGNSSPKRQRVTVLVHDNDFSDLAACTFWLAPGTPLADYALRTYATEAWTNATVSVYPSTVGTSPTAEWLLLDNASLKATSAVTLGTECFEPGSVQPPPSSNLVARNALTTAPSLLASPAPTPGAAEVAEAPASGIAIDRWVADGFLLADELPASSAGFGWMAVATEPGPRTLTGLAAVDLSAAASAWLTFESWLTAVDSRAEVQVSADGVTWETVAVVAPSDTWELVEIDLSPYVSGPVYVRLVFEGAAPLDPAWPDTWRVGGLHIETAGTPGGS